MNIPTVIEENEEILKKRSGRWFCIEDLDPRDKILLKKTINNNDIDTSFSVDGELEYDAKIEDDKIYFKYNG